MEHNSALSKIRFPDPFKIFEVTLQITNRCTLECIHCGSSSGPNASQGPSRIWCERFAEKVASRGFHDMEIIGGEPMLRPKVLLPLIRTATTAGLAARFTSNGFWGENRSICDRSIKQLSDAGLKILSLSIDKLHTAKISHQSFLNIAHSFREAGFPFSLRIYGFEGEWEEVALVKEIEAICAGHCTAYTSRILPIGRAQENAARLKLDGWIIPEEDNHPCHWVLFPVVDADQYWYLCANGPTQGHNSPLCIGKMSDPDKFDKMLDRHYHYPIFRAIRTIGPLGMLELLGVPSGVGEKHNSVCDICLHRLFSPNNIPRLRALFTDEDISKSLSRHFPSQPCSMCGANSWFQRGGEWLCSDCYLNIFEV